MRKSRLVLKVGSAVLTESEEIAKERVLNLVEFISKLKKVGYEVILVSSGAVAMGYTKLKLDKSILSNRQALASIGQPFLMVNYERKFKKYGIEVAQVLLTADDFDSRARTKHSKNVVDRLLESEVLPIINENDVTATEELVFGDNDQLSAYATYYFRADMLVILTDIDGYYDSNPKENPKASLRRVVTNIDESELNQEPSANTQFATGGIVTKLKASKFLLDRGIDTFLSSGFNLTFAEDFLLKQTHSRGTLFSKR